MRMQKTLRSLCPRKVRDAEKMLMEQEDGKLGVPNGRSMDVLSYANYLAERAKGMQCRSNFYGNTKWWNNHIAIPLTPKEKELAEEIGLFSTDWLLQATFHKHLLFCGDTQPPRSVRQL